MTDRGTPPMDHPAFEVAAAAGMYPYVCSYVMNGKKMGITLYGTDAAQILDDNCDVLTGLKIEGILDSKIPADESERWAMIDAYNRKGSKP